jgi:regulator of protease activity HflC (stomatin/prohibitin superfamily)
MPIRPAEVVWNEGELAKKVKLGTIPRFLVREHERALFIKDGKIYKEFLPGVHMVKGLPIFGTSVLIYVNLMPFQLKWGLPESFSKDNVRVGSYGTIEFKIKDPKMFYSQVLGGRELYTIANLREDILDNIQGVLRSELANLTVREIYLERDILIGVVRAKLQELFLQRGMDYERIEIQGVNIPEKIKEAMESIKLKSIELEKKKSELALESEKARIEAERYKMLREAGVDALKLKELEIAEKSPEVLEKKYSQEAYKEALKTRPVGTTIVTPQAPVQAPPSQPEGAKFAFCPFCGNKLGEGFAFCPKCGKKLP